MTPSNYLDEAKKVMGISSDYELAKRMEMPDKHLPAIRRGERAIPLDVAYRLAITSQRDPAEVVADLACQREKNEAKRAFWVSFISRARLVAAVVLCTLVWSFSGISGDAAKALGGVAAMAASAAYLRRFKVA